VADPVFVIGHPAVTEAFLFDNISTRARVCICISQAQLLTAFSRIAVAAPAGFSDNLGFYRLQPTRGYHGATPP
jgi:hypothetical protein